MGSVLTGSRWDESNLGRVLSDRATSGIALADGDFCVTYVNPALARMCGRPAEQLTGGPIFDLFDLETAAEVRALTARAQSEPLAFSLGRVRSPAGTGCRVEVRDMIVTFEGRPVHLFSIIDVTQREELIRSLSASEERFRIATALTRDYIYEYDRQTDKLSWSSNIREFLGFSREEMPDTLKSMLDLTHPEDRKASEDALIRHAADNADFVEENRLRKKDGSYLLVRHRSTAVLGPDGVAVRWIGAVSDITEARRMEDELRANEEKFRLAATMVSDYIYQYNTVRQRFEWSDEVVNFMGYRRDEMPGTHEELHQLVHPDDRDRVAASTARHAADLTPLEEEYRIRRRDGRYVLISNRAVPVREPDGKVRRWVGAASDITETRRMEDELRAGEEKFRVAAELVSDCIYEWNGQTLSFDWSGDVDRFFGYEPGGFPRDLQNMNAAIHRDDRERVLAAAKRHYDTGEPFSEEYRVRRQDGSYILISSRARAIRNDRGEIQRWIGVNTDVTEARRIEDELRAGEERFRVAAGLVTDYVYEYHMESDKLTWSSDIGELLGFSREEMPDTMGGVLAFLHPEDRERVKSAIIRHAKDHDLFAEEYRARRQDGSYILIFNRSTAVIEPDGSVRRWIGALNDITESRRIELELRESEAKFWSFVNESAYGYAELDLDANVTFANARCEEIIGLALGSNSGINLREIIVPEEHGRAFHNLDRLQRQALDGPREYLARHRDGRLVPVEINAHPLRRGGKIIGFQTTVLNISPRKLIEAEARRREEILQAVTRGAETFLRSVSWRDHITDVLEDVGRAAGVQRAYIYSILPAPSPNIIGELWHWTAEGYPLKSALENLNVADWKDDPVLQLAVAALSQGNHFTGRYRDFSPEIARAFPNSTDLSFQGVPIFVAGELWGTFGFDYIDDHKLDSPAEIDIIKILANTLGAAIQREQAEEIIRESERNYRLVVENLVDVIWTADLDFNMTYFSPSVEALTGYTVEEALKNKVSDVLVPESYTDHQKHFRHFQVGLEAEAAGKGSGMESSPVEALMRCKDGATIWVEVSVSVSRDTDGRPTGFQGTLRNISRRKRAEQALILSEEKLRAQYNAIPVPTYTWQREGDDFVLVDYNEAAVRITQGTIAKYLNVKASDLYRDNLDIANDIQKCFREKSVFEREIDYRYISLDQQKTLVVKYAFVAPDQVIAHTEDITEKRRALERLAEAEVQLKQTLSAEVRMRRTKDYDQPEKEDENLQLYASPAWQRTMAEARIAASSDGIVLLLGNSGVGKTYLAGWIHQHSSRAEGPYFDINCASLTPSLIESELFGHEAGAFTGSKGRRRGLLELTHNGTLFLDEIGDMPLDLQAKLLTFLDTRRFMRLGGETKISVNSRIMVATNRDLPTLVQKGSFREDLYYRLNVFALAVPSLADRKEDIPMLTAGILRRLAREMGLHQPPVLTPEAIRAITSHSWPGNVRELKNMLERVLLKADNKSIISELPIQLPPPPAQLGPRLGVLPEHDFLTEGQNFDHAVETYMQGLIRMALKKAKTKTEAASLLGISRHALNRYCRKYGID